MATLLLEIGCEELPASACREAEAQLPGLARTHLGKEPTKVLVGPRRLAVVIEDLPDPSAPVWVKGPPVSAPDKAREGFARRHGVHPGDLEEREGFLGVHVPGPSIEDRLRALVHEIQFSKTMRWDDGGHRFSRPVRWICELLDDRVVGGGFSYGHRFTHGRVEIPHAGAYEATLREANVEPDQAERERRIRQGLDAVGSWSDPLGKLAEVVHLVEWPAVLEGAFDERFLELPERVVVTAMQSHQRYFPLGGNRFAFVANGGDPEVVRAGNEQVLEGRLDDASFTFERDVKVGIDALAERLAAITFFQEGGSFADKTERVLRLVAALGGGEAAREAARLAKADQASELVREFPDLEGYIGAEYARLAGYPEAVAKAVEEQYLPDAAGGPLPSTETGKVLAAADKLDTLDLSFSLGHRPTGSRDPFGLRRAAIGLCRLAVDGGLVIERSLLEGEVRDFVEERLEGLLEGVPVEMVRAARASAAGDLGGVAAVARALASLEPSRLAAIHEVYTRAHRIAGKTPPGEWSAELLTEEAERELAKALDAARPALSDAELTAAFDAAEGLAAVVARFFEDVLVMAEDSAVRENRLRLLLDLRDTVGQLGDFSQIPL